MREIVVIGGGIAGAAAAAELSRRGAAVNLVDREGPGAAATGASAGMLAPQYESGAGGPLYEVLLRARDLYPDWVERVHALSGIRLPLRRDGMLVANLTAEEERESEEAVAWQRAGGAAAEILAPKEAAALQPGLGSEALSYLWLPDEGQVDSQVLAGALGAVLGAAGVRVIRGRVTRLRERSGAVTAVDLEDGRSLPADAVVLAAGAWSGEIGGLPRHVPVRPIRGQMLRYAPPPGTLTRLLAMHAGRYLVPRADGSVLAGSTMEDVGFDRSLQEAGLAAVAGSARRLLPALGRAPVAERWADLRPISDDRLPIIGPEPRLEGLFYATGYGRNGILLGPLAGEAVAEMVLGGDPGPAWAAFGIERFGGPTA